jgi:hypothetical protein
MPIIKPGFSEGFGGRSQAASFGRQANYLLEPQRLDQQIKVDQDAICDIRAETLNRIQAPGGELDPARGQDHGMPDPSSRLEPIRRVGFAELDRVAVEVAVATAVEEPDPIPDKTTRRGSRGAPSSSRLAKQARLFYAPAMAAFRKERLSLGSDRFCRTENNF